jgi:hypothetical protein
MLLCRRVTFLTVPRLSCNFMWHGSKHDIAAPAWTAFITVSASATAGCRWQSTLLCRRMTSLAAPWLSCNFI